MSGRRDDLANEEEDVAGSSRAWSIRFGDHAGEGGLKDMGMNRTDGWDRFKRCI